MVEHDEKLSNALNNCADGCENSFAVIHQVTSAALFQIVRNIVREDESAADILQRGYLRIWQSAHEYQDKKGRAFTWMLVIMRNLAIDEWRRQKRQAGNAEACAKLQDHSVCIERNTEMTVLKSRLDEALRSLPARLEYVVRRIYLQGHSSQKISEEMEISVNTVRSWARRGLVRMKEFLPEDSLNHVMTLH